MWNSSMSGQGTAGVRYDVGGAGQYLAGLGRSEDRKDDLDANKDVITKLLKQLDDAEKTSKTQTVQDVRDKLKEMRSALGDEKFKEILEQIKKLQSESLLALLKRLFPDLFPDEAAPAPSPKPSPGGGGGGGGGRVSPSDFGPSESMTNKPFTSGARFNDYKVDKSNPGKKPGVGAEAGNIWAGFKQGPDGNCVTVSAIKSAMLKFGQEPTDVFRDVKASGDGWDVQMRDGFQLHLSKNELTQGAQQARFEGTDPKMITNANFMYAASAKRAQMEGNNGFGYGNDHNARRSFLDAAKSLNDGEHRNEGLDRLGLKGLYRQSSSHELASGELGVVNYGGHSMAVIGGSIEKWGGRGGRPKREDPGEAYAFI